MHGEKLAIVRRLPLFAAMGVGIGAIARSQVPAVVVPIVWLLLLEPNLIAPRFTAIERYLPGVASSIAGNNVRAVIKARIWREIE